MEIDKTLIAGVHEFGLRFHFLRQQAAAARAEMLDHLRALLWSRELHLDLNDVGNLGELVTAIVGYVIVQR